MPVSNCRCSSTTIIAWMALTVCLGCTLESGPKHRWFAATSRREAPLNSLNSQRTSVVKSTPEESENSWTVEDAANTRPVSFLEPMMKESEESQSEFPPGLPSDRETNPKNVGGELTPNPIELETVLTAVELYFPALMAAAAEMEIAEGKALSASGQFDFHAKASTLSQPLGFYQNQRAAAMVTQPTFANGGLVYGGYKLGRGDFPTWYKERQTDGNGEYAAGIVVPLLKDRDIDKRRADLFRANLDVQSVGPMVRTQLIGFSREAAYAYWYWLAMGQSLKVQENLLKLAEARVQQIALQVEKGDLPKIASIDNDRFIASRKTKLIEASRKFQAASIKLSLYLRDPSGSPITPGLAQLPADFPVLLDQDPVDFDRDLSLAIAERPEVQELDLELQKVRVDAQAAENQLLPKLDAVLEASKDTGTPASAIEDKTPFEMEAGLVAEVPLQRRDARGKLRTAQGKQTQLLAKREFLINKITIAVQDAYSAIQNARERYVQSVRTKELAIQALEIGRQRFLAGDIDLIVLNIYEQAEADAELQLIDSEAEYFAALADYRAALGRTR